VGLDEQVDLFGPIGRPKPRDPAGGRVLLADDPRLLVPARLDAL
jgi:hypothetical protein